MNLYDLDDTLRFNSPIVVCDIDGTLFDNSQRKDWVPEDRSVTANWHEFNARHIYDRVVVSRVEKLRRFAEGPVIYLTSRTEIFRGSTAAQLNMVGAPHGALLMRAEDDHRPSADFKLWALERLPDVPFVLIDDDPRVCEAVRREFPRTRVIEVQSYDCSIA